MKKANDSFSLAVVMDPIEGITPYKDTSLALMLAAQELGAKLFYMKQDDLYVQDGRAYGVTRPVRVFDDNDHWFALNEPEVFALAEFDAILMRKDPPVDKRFIHTTYMLEQAVRDGGRVINDPASLRDFNEKLFALRFPQFSPPHIVASDLQALRNFYETHERIIIKPLDAMGGQGVFMVEKGDVNFDVIWEVQTQRGRYPVIAQRFIPEIAKGDKRVVVFDGEPFGHALVRLPKQGSIRGNLAAGGSYDVRPLNEKEREIAEAVGKVLVERGVMFAGIDIIGDYLIEVNITSPTGLRELSKECGENAPALLMQKIMSASAAS